MTSLQTRIKQIPANDGFYITVGDCRNSFLVNAGTDAAPSLSTNIYARSTVVSTFMASAGAGVFRDHGKTLLSAGRVFRKVQLMVSTVGANVTGGTDGVAGPDAAPVNYLTGYIELPGQGTGSGSGYAPVARLG